MNKTAKEWAQQYNVTILAPEINQSEVLTEQEWQEANCRWSQMGASEPINPTKQQ